MAFAQGKVEYMMKNRTGITKPILSAAAAAVLFASLQTAFIVNVMKSDQGDAGYVFSFSQQAHEAGRFNALHTQLALEFVTLSVQPTTDNSRLRTTFEAFKQSFHRLNNPSNIRVISQQFPEYHDYVVKLREHMEELDTDIGGLAHGATLTQGQLAKIQNRTAILFGMTERLRALERSNQAAFSARSAQRQWINVALFQAAWFLAIATVLLAVYRRRKSQRLLAEKDHLIAANAEQLAKARDAIMAKNKFLGTVSHELRTPLQRIFASIDLLEGREYDERQKRALDRIDSGAKQLDALLHDFLDFSRLDSGKLQLRTGVFNPMEVVKKIVANYQSAAKSKGMKLVCALGNSRVEVVSDVFRFQQIATNLITNAIKYAGQGTITVSLIYRTEGIQTTLGLSVIDEGPGIAPEFHQMIFDPFTQVDQTNTRAKDGAGMGLAIVKRLVEDLFGGNIWVDSKLGEGARFEVRIPVDLATKQQRVVAEMEPSDVSSRFDTSAVETGPSRHLLLVDDHPEILDLFHSVLQRIGYKCDLSPDGFDAIKKCQLGRYDAILLDIQMPGMDGFEVAKHIRTGAGPNQHTPIIAVSAHSEHFSTPEQRKVFSNYLLKPVRSDVLNNTLHQVWSEIPAEF